MKNRIFKISGTLLIFLLLVSLVCLSFIYMFSLQTRDELKFGSSDMLALEQDFAAAGYVEFADTENVLPVFAGVYCEDGKSVGAFSGKVKKSLYETIFGVAEKYLLSGKTEPVEREYAERLLEKAFSNGFAYIKYAVAYPKSLLVNFFDRNTFSSQISDEYICEIFVFYDDSYGSVISLAFSDTGKCYVYSAENPDGRDFNNKIADEYNNTEGTFSFSLAGNVGNRLLVSEEIFLSGISSHTVISADNLEFPSVILSNSYELFISNDVCGALLSAFTLNPEKVSVFTDSDGAKTYFEEGQNVRINADGSAEYSSVGSHLGINVGSVIGYHIENGEFSLRDKIGATLVIVGKIVRAAGFSDDIGIRLCHIGSDDDGNLVISYDLTCDGISVINGKEAFSFTFAGENIKKAHVFLPNVTKTENTKYLPSALWNFSAYALSGGEKADFFPVYNVLDSDIEIFAEYVGIFRRGTEDAE